MTDLVNYFYTDLIAGHVNFYSTFEESFATSINLLKRKGISIKINIYDETEAITRFKSLVCPKTSYETIKLFEFILICYFLYKNGYYIKEFPSFLERPSNLYDFSNKEIKNLAAKKYGRNGNLNGVAWSDRESVINELEFLKLSTNVVNLNYELNEIFKLVSTRNADFEIMALDEKLEQIRNVFEYIGKKDAKGYVEIPFGKLTDNYITTEQVIKFQNDLQCFRHGQKELIQKRTEIDDDRKSFMIDYGLTILHIAKGYIDKNNSSACVDNMNS